MCTKVSVEIDYQSRRKKKTRKVFRNSTLTSTQSISVKDIFHSKARRKHTTVDPTFHKKVHHFCERGTISRVLPNKVLIKKVNLSNDTSQGVPIRIIKMALFEAYYEFMKEDTNVKVQRRVFEMKRP